LYLFEFLLFVTMAVLIINNGRYNNYSLSMIVMTVSG